MPQQKEIVIFGTLFVSLGFILCIAAFGNIESNGEGSYCVNKIPKRSVPANCTSNLECEELLAIPTSPLNELRCGSQGECISKELPQNEHCKEACEKSACGKFCLQEHETKSARYCIETRDHPNEMGSVKPQNKYYCTCILQGESRHYRRYPTKYSFS